MTFVISDACKPVKPISRGKRLGTGSLLVQASLFGRRLPPPLPRKLNLAPESGGLFLVFSLYSPTTTLFTNTFLSPFSPYGLVRLLYLRYSVVINQSSAVT